MKLGLIGYPLGHSWSPEIHKYTIGVDYEKWELNEEELEDFLTKKEFDGCNVTIPYKQAVIPYLDELDETAKEIGAINTIVNRNGKLIGYNTDYEGLKDMISSNGIDLEGKNVAILGTGGASKAAVAAVKALGGIPQLVSRHHKENAIDYLELKDTIDQYSILLNTTPVGMFPECDTLPLEEDLIKTFEAVIDIVANPLMTRLQFVAKTNGIPYCGGFEMLVRQAVAADRYFLEQDMDPSIVASCMKELLHEKRNIVLIGMPTSGKTTISKLIAEKTGKQAVEMDDEIVKILGTSIRECFDTKGEAYFRQVESDYIKSLRDKQNLIISCGGGVIKNNDNMRYLNENGVIVWIRRDLNKLYPTDDRPLASNIDALKQLFEERKDLYHKFSDLIVDNDGTLEETVQKILEATGENTTK